MELLALETFRAVMDEGGIAAASRQLFTVQSNVTTRIQRLEAELGVELFFRQGRSLVPTPAGRTLYDYAEQLLQLERKAASAVKLAGNVAGELRIGTMESFAAVRLPAALQALKESFPLLSPVVETNTSADLLDAVLAHRIDCAFVGGPVVHEDLVVLPVLEEELVEVGCRQGGDESTLIVFRHGCAYRTRAEAWLQGAGKADKKIMELGTLEGILGCVAVGLGVTLMPRMVVERSNYADRLLCNKLRDGKGRIPTQLVMHRQSVATESIHCLASAFAVG